MQDSSISTASIRTMVDRFYERVREDATLGPVFEKQLAGKWQEHMPRMYAFWTKVLLGQGEFQGNVFGKHMALSGIEKEHFVRWLALFRETVNEVFTDAETADIIAVAERVAGSLQLGYFGKYVI